MCISSSTGRPPPPTRGGANWFSDWLAVEYAGKTEKTLVRDLNVLTEMGLITRHHGRRIAARSERIRACLGEQAKEPAPCAKRNGPSRERLRPRSLP